MSPWISSKRWSLLGRNEKRSSKIDAEQSDDNTTTITPDSQSEDARQPRTFEIPSSQAILLLNAVKQPYELASDLPIPKLENEDEVLIRTRAIGLNPIDWKAPDFNFGIPELPYISGRELAGDVVLDGGNNTTVKNGDRVIAISTDYRDQRKGAYQEYVVAPDYNLVHLPPHVTYEEGSTLGVAFVAAALALGVSVGLDFSHVSDGPDLFQLVRSIEESRIPEDVRAESLTNIRDRERAKPGDWLAIWGGSATSANLTIQLAKLAGLRVVVIVDKAKHGLWISNHPTIRPDLLVDSYDPERAINIIKANSKDGIRFGLDTRGRETAEHLLRAIAPKGAFPSPDPENGGDALLPTPPGTPGSDGKRTHIIGMSGLPKIPVTDSVVLHTVPIKLFHEVKEVGAEMTSWLARLLSEGRITPPKILGVQDGLENINSGLDRMRRGEISGGKLVVKV